MCEEYGSRRGSSTCNQAKECIGKKGCETEDKTCYQTSQRSGYMDNGCEILRHKIQLHMSSFHWCVLIVLFSHDYRSSGTFTQRSLRIVISCAIWLMLYILQYDSKGIFIFPTFWNFYCIYPTFVLIVIMTGIWVFTFLLILYTLSQLWD